MLEDAPLRRGQRVEPGREHGVHGLGERLDVLRPLLADPVDHLLREQGVAGGALGDLWHELAVTVRARCRSRWGAGRRPARASRPGSAARARSWSRCAARRPSPGGGRAARRAPGRRSGPGRAPSAPGTRSGRAFPRRPSGCPRARSPPGVAGSPPRPGSAPRRTAGRASAAGPPRRGPRWRIACSAGGSMPSGRAIVAAIRSGGSSVSASETTRLDPAEELRPGQLGVVGVDDLELAAEDLAERPVGEPRAVGGAAPDPEGRLLRRAPPIWVASSRRRRDLADPGLADHGDQVRAALAADPVEQRHEQRRLVLAADQGRLGAGAAGGRAGDQDAGTASHAGTGSDLPFRVSGSSS